MRSFSVMQRNGPKFVVDVGSVSDGASFHFSKLGKLFWSQLATRLGILYLGEKYERVN